MVPTAPEKRCTPLSPPPPPYGEAMSLKSNENEDCQGFTRRINRFSERSGDAKMRWQ
jgi:hypothetical protein